MQHPAAAPYKGFRFMSSAMLLLAKLDPSVGGGVRVEDEGFLR